MPTNKKRWLVHLFLILTIIGGVTTLHYRAASAQTAGGDFNITTSPLPVLLKTFPGQPITTRLRVQNSGNKTAIFKVSLKKFKAFGDSSKPILIDKQPGDAFFDWVSFDKNTIKAEPGVWNEVTMTIKPPSTAAFGYYYAVVFSGGTANISSGGNTSTVSGATAVLVLMDVQVPGEKKELKINSFTADKKMYEYLPANFTVKVSNTGSIYQAPSGSIFISRGGKNVAVLDINPSRGNILPNTYRDYSPSWNDGFPVYTIKREHGQIVSTSNGKPEHQLVWDFNKTSHLRFGHYTAHLLMTYDNGTSDIPLEAELSFWVLPWGLILLVIAIPVVPAALVYYAMRRRDKRHKTRYAKYKHE